jgi:hypothetical protein
MTHLEAFCLAFSKGNDLVIQTQFSIPGAHWVRGWGRTLQACPAHRLNTQLELGYFYVGRG